MAGGSEPGSGRKTAAPGRSRAANPPLFGIELGIIPPPVTIWTDSRSPNGSRPVKFQSEVGLQLRAGRGIDVAMVIAAKKGELLQMNANPAGVTTSEAAAVESKATPKQVLAQTGSTLHRQRPGRGNEPVGEES